MEKILSPKVFTKIDGNGVEKALKPLIVNYASMPGIRNS